MDYRKSAQGVYEHIGGRENIVSAAHCATRLRLVIADNAKCSKEALEQVEGVKGVFEASGQLQIIFGTGVVNKVYEEFLQIAQLKEASKEEVKQAAAMNQNGFKRAVKTLGDIFVPIIPAIVASGLLMGLLEGLCNLYPAMAQSGTYTIVHLFSNAAFVYLPILIAMSAAKVFGGNMFLGAVIGMIMIHTDLINAWSVAGMNPADIPTATVFGLYDIRLVGYQGHVIPVVIAVWLMSWLERRLHKLVPEIIDLFVTPLVTVLVTGYLTLTVIGPVFSTIENWVLLGAKGLIALPFGIGGAIVGGLYAPTVVAGVHHMYNAIEAGLLSSGGMNTWMPVATAANVAQGAAALAVAVKTKNKRTKSMALPASLSAFLGITEPAIFGVNIRYMKAFVAGCIGGVCGGFVAGLMGVGATAYGITGIFGFLITTHNTLGYALIMLVAAGVAFALSWIMYREDSPQEKEVVTGRGEDRGTGSAKVVIEPTENRATAGNKSPVGNRSATVENKSAAGNRNATVENKAAAEDKATTAPQSEEEIRGQEVHQIMDEGQHRVFSPVTGLLIPLTEVHDETFAGEVLGKGIAIVPTEGKVTAPFNATVESVFPTKHAVGLKSDDGVEVLIHVGINTVNLDGACYECFIQEGSRVTKGQRLLEFDIEGIKATGYDITTPVVVTNSDAYTEVRVQAKDKILIGQELLTCVNN